MKAGSRAGGHHRPKMLTGLLASRAKVSQMFTVRESVADYRYAAALIAIASRMSATNSR